MHRLPPTSLEPENRNIQQYLPTVLGQTGLYKCVDPGQMLQKAVSDKLYTVCPHPVVFF